MMIVICTAFWFAICGAAGTPAKRLLRPRVPALAMTGCRYSSLALVQGYRVPAAGTLALHLYQAIKCRLPVL